MRRLKIAILSVVFVFTSATQIWAVEPNTFEPEVGAVAGILMDYKTGRVMWEKNGYEPMPMASTTKIMTAILAIESGKQDQIITISRKASLAPKMKMNLSAGEQISIKDLMYALMLESANDAAVAIAEGVGGTEDNFCAMMTAKAKELGATDTIFESPNGLDKGDHHSTAYDMALISRYAMANPAFVELINTPSATIKSNKRSYTFMNKNRLLREYPGGNGIKTGFTNKAGHCFVGSATRGDMQLISVVFASGWGDKGKQGKWKDTRKILDYGFGNFSYRTLIEAGNTAGDIPVTRSRTESVKLVYNSDLVLPLKDGEAETTNIVINKPQTLLAPVNAGDSIGTADVYIGGKFNARVPLALGASASRHDLKTSMEKVLGVWFSGASKTDINVELPELPVLPGM